MRRRLVVVALATTSLVAFAFAIPLGLLVREVARDRAMSAAERDMATVAPVLALTANTDLIRNAVRQTPTGAAGRLAVWTGGTLTGDPAPADPDQLALARERRLAFSARDRDGIALYQPVVTDEGAVAVVRARIGRDQLSDGLPTAWSALAAVALVLVVAAVLIADRLGRTVTRPARDVASVARRLGHGELDARARRAGDEPAEIGEIAAALNFLATRIQGLMAAERERVADLSHRLRTPLTSVRLEAETVATPALARAVDRLEAAITELVTEARRPIAPEVAPERCDLAQVVRDRMQFWGVLGEEQSRTWTCKIEPEGAAPVHVPPKEAAAALDGLLGNVFSHTPDGTAYRVTLLRHDGTVELAVEDEGPGIDDPAAVIERGHSERGSTGLGLDIARRTAEAAGGDLEIGPAARGGTRVCLRVPLFP